MMQRGSSLCSVCQGKPTWCKHCREKEERRRRHRQDKLQRVHADSAHDLARVTQFLKENGFAPYVNAKRTSGQESYTYPVHVALLQDGEEMYRLLARCGADTSLRDSSGSTARELGSGQPVVS